MKTKLLYSALIASCLVALSSCDPNDWNDKLDGFDGDKGITNKQMIAYTFTDADYTNLAANSANIKQAGDTLSKELKAVGTQHYFTDKITARDYIPNFLSDSDFAYFTLSDGSSINITYRVAGNVPEEVTNFGAASEYTVTETIRMPGAAKRTTSRLSRLSYRHRNTFLRFSLLNTATPRKAIWLS